MAGFNPTARFQKKCKELSENREKFKLQQEELDGVPLMVTVPAARIAEQREKVVIRPDDVFIATYPKCGSSWTQQIVKLIVHNGVETGADCDEFIPWHEHMTLAEIESITSPRFFKSHLPYHLMPGGGDPEKTKAKYITVIRNPKDSIVSYYSHTKKARRTLHVPSWETFFNSFIEGKVEYGPFYSHFLGWWAHKDAPNILILTYEGMKRDPRSAVTAIAEFLGYNLTDEVIDKIVTDTSFDKMKDNMAANKEGNDMTWMGDKSIKFMRKGIIGDWKNVLTDEQSARIDAIVTEKMKGSGIVFDYGDED